MPSKDTAGDSGPDKSDRGHVAKPPRDQVKKGHLPKTQAPNRHDGPHEDAIDDQRPSPKSGHRLRMGRRAR